MNSRSKLLTFVMVLVLCPAFVVSTPAKDKWVKVQSKNFTLIGNAGEKRVREVATKLEQFRHVFIRLFPKMKFTSPIPTSVVVFKNQRSFKQYKSIKWAAGYFQPGSDINYIALHTGGDREHLFTTIFHEYIHFLVNNNLGKSRMPPWFGEGIAEYYDQFKIEKDQIVTLGSPNSSHLESLQRSRLIPFDTFFNIDHFSLKQQGSHSVNIFYAQSWALMHFLIKGNGGARNEQLQAFLGMLTKGLDPRQAFSQAFKTDYKTMEKELRRYIGKSRYGITTVTFKKKLLFDEEMQTSPLSEAESKAHLGDLLYHIRKYEKAEAVLNESLALNPAQAFANATMGSLKMRQNKYSEAKSYLEKAVQADDSNYRIYYQYADVLSREGRSPGSVMDVFSPETAAKIRQALKKAIALNPSFPASYDLMARVSLITGDNIDEGIAYLRKAISLSPGNQWYMLNLANLYMRKRDIKQAIPVVEAVYKSADEPQLRAYAQRLLSDLQRFQASLEEAKRNGYTVRDGNETGGVVRLTRRRDGKPYSELTEAEQEKFAAEALNKSINQALRKPKDGEKRMMGYLSKVRCVNGRVLYSVKTDGGVKTFTSKDFQSLELAIYNVDIGTFQLGCDSIKKDVRGVITYKPSANSRSKTIGQIVAVEFVAEEFKLLGN